ncbi:MAG: PQQ-binding-like beta-propeller repeat protein [Saprospiraceae bacterium]
MRILNLSIILLFLLQINIKAQLKPVHETELSSACDAVFVHSLTGIPVFKTKTSYIGMNPETFEKMWEIKRLGVASLSETTTHEGFDDYFELPATTITYLGNSFVDVVTGNVIVDGEKDGIKRINSFHLFPAQDLLVVKVVADGVFRLYGFNPIRKTFLWKTDIDKLATVSMSGITDSNPVYNSTHGLKPYIASIGDIVYIHKKDMMLIDPVSGALKWTQSLEPGIVLFSKSSKLIAIAERRGGLGGLMDMSDGDKFGKRLIVVDAATGEEAWKKEIKLDGNILFMQPYKDGFIVAHEEGFNIYDFNSAKGEPEWKKDFSAKEISDIVEEGDKIMVYYKNRRMLMDPVTGDEVWKKPEKLAKETPVFNGGQTVQIGDVKITDSGYNLRFVKTEGKKYEIIPAQHYVLDEATNTVFAVDERITTTSTGQKNSIYTVYAVNLNSLDIISRTLDLRSQLSGIDVVKGGFFIYGPKEYYLCKLKDGKLETVKYDYFPNPGSFGRGLLGFATAAGTLAGWGSGLVGAGQSMMVGSQEDYNKYVRRMDISEDAGNAAFFFQKRGTMAQIDKEYAFFFSKDEGKNLALFQIRKQDAAQIARYQFDDKTPIYEIDYVNGNLYYMNGKSLKIFRLKGT